MSFRFSSLVLTLLLSDLLWCASVALAGGGGGVGVLDTIAGD